MKQIKTIRYSKLRNGEAFKFFAIIKVLSEQHTPTLLGIEDDFLELSALLVKLDNVFKPRSKSFRTAAIAEADEKRDKTYKTIKAKIKTDLEHFNPQKKEYANKLDIVFENYGNVTDKPYEEETALLNDLLRDLMMVYTNEIYTFDLQDWVNELNNQNQRLDSLMIARYDELSAKPEYKVKDILDELYKCYLHAVERIEAFMVINNDPNLIPFIKDVNVRVDRFNNVIAQREGRKKN